MVGLVRGLTRGHEDHPIEAERRASLLSRDQMSHVQGIKRSPHYADAIFVRHTLVDARTGDTA